MALRFKFRRTFLKVVLIFALLIFVLYIFKNISYGLENRSMLSGNTDCRKFWVNNYLHQMCYNFTKKLVFGNLCQELCNAPSITVKKCFIHHEETRIIDINRGFKKMVLKLKTVEQEIEPEVMDQLNEIWNYWLEEHEFPIFLLRQFIIDNFHRFLGFESEIRMDRYEDIVNAVLPSRTHRLSKDQLKSLYFFLKHGAVFPLIYYQKMKQIPAYFGHCGQMYGMERLIPLGSFFPSIFTPLDWKQRAKLALSLLDFINDLQFADRGPLHICDMKTQDFGFTGKYQIKLIDFDMLFTYAKTKELIGKGSCNSDEDCQFFDCKSSCDPKLRSCTETMISNNLQVLCQNILKPAWPLRGLLTDVPARLRTSLNKLVNQCRSQEFGRFAPNSTEFRYLLSAMRKVITAGIEN